MMQKEGYGNKQENKKQTMGENPPIRALLHKSLCLIFTLVKQFWTVKEIEMEPHYLARLRKTVFQIEQPDLMAKTETKAKKWNTNKPVGLHMKIKANGNKQNWLTNSKSLFNHILGKAFLHFITAILSLKLLRFIKRA